MSPRSRDRAQPPSGRASTSTSNRIGLAVLVAAVAIAGLVWFRSASEERPAPVSPASANYVGSRTCAGCHESQSAEWRPSQHARAMAEASEATVAGQFDGRQVTHHGVTSTFFRRDGQYLVRTDGPDGKLTEFEVAYTFGVEPLQQYLIRFPGGRLQALGLAWDARPAASGGQRWFHLYPNERIPAGDPLHWTGLQQNWNFMCADCHSTNLRKGYDPASRTFDTTWSEINVGCEACHGPGSRHVAEAKAQRWSDGYGLVARLDERRGVTWALDQASLAPMRSQPRTSNREIDVCARCHSRRAQLTDDWHAGQAFEDGFRPSALDALLYYADGQQRDEVYTYGSFLQSRMHAKGVTCSDCHNPHTGRLRQSGNELCTQCHRDPKLDSPAHHFHRQGTAASSCVSCHMPTTTYMVIDPRRDHSFRVPRPDLAAATGAPNACTSSCHTNRQPAWAAAEIARNGGKAQGFQTHAGAFGRFDRGEPNAESAVMAVAADQAQSSIVRASALGRIASRGVPADPGVIQPMLGDPDPMIRRRALEALRYATDADRLRLVSPLLSDPVRTVRIEAARTIADVADRGLTGGEAAAFESAFGELAAAERFNADRPDAQVELGAAWLMRSRYDEAIAAFREALALDATFTPASVNLADAYRLRGDEVQAESILRAAVTVSPADAGLRHALGLSLVRQKRSAEALAELSESVRLDAANARYGYVLGVALRDAGRMDEALATLDRTHRAHPADQEVLIALVLYSEEAGRTPAARTYASRLLTLAPNDPGVRDLASRLGASGGVEEKRP